MSDENSRSNRNRRDGAPRSRDGAKDGRRPRDESSRPDRRGDGLAGPAKWGRVARRGAGGLSEETRDMPPRDPGDRGGKRPPREADAVVPTRPIPPRPDRRLPDEDDLQRSAKGAVKRGRKSGGRERSALPPRPSRQLDPEVALRGLVGDARAKRLSRRLHDAGRAFAADRFEEARKALVPLVKEAPELPEGRELLGLSLYRMGKWRDAIENLEAFRELSGSTEQHPVLADCHRAMGHWSDVDELWAELGEVSPSNALMIEGRIVLAGAKADQGELPAAIAILEDGWRLPKKPRPHHLRRAYALADLYERAGRSPRARQLFVWIANHDPDLADVTARVRSLS